MTMPIGSLSSATVRRTSPSAMARTFASASRLHGWKARSRCPPSWRAGATSSPPPSAWHGWTLWSCAACKRLRFAWGLDGASGSPAGAALGAARGADTRLGLQLDSHEARPRGGAAVDLPLVVPRTGLRGALPCAAPRRPAHTVAARPVAAPVAARAFEHHRMEHPRRIRADDDRFGSRVDPRLYDAGA